MATRTVAALFAVLLFGCGGEEPPEPVEPAEFAELCGQTEPIRMLQFEPWRVVDYGWYWKRFGDRRVMHVHYADTETARDVLWSVGMCGEAPRQLVSGNFDSWTLPGQDWPFVCDRDTNELRVVDPSGERPPRLVAQLPGSCNSKRTDAGVVVIRTEAEDSVAGELVLFPSPADIWVDDVEPVVLVNAVKTRFATPEQSSWDTVQGEGDEVYVVTVDDELVRVSVPAGDVEVLATGVRTFELGWVPDESELGYAPRYLLWQRMEMSNDDPELPEGEILLLDRTTNELTSLGHSLLTSAHLRATNWMDSGIVQLPVRVDGDLVLRIFQIPSLNYVDVPATLEPLYMLGDDRHLVVRIAEDQPWGTLDTHTGELISFASYFANLAYDYWHESRALALLPAADDGNVYADRELWLVRGGDPPELVANRATVNNRLMPDGRLLTGVNLDEEGVGELIVVDNFEERHVDHGVLTSHTLVGLDGEDDDLVAYTILAGERAGVWLARVP
jgi:hypothetical protein